MTLGQTLRGALGVCLVLACAAESRAAYVSDITVSAFNQASGWTLSDLSIGTPASGSQAISFKLTLGPGFQVFDPFRLNVIAGPVVDTSFTPSLNFAVTIVNNTGAILDQLVIGNVQHDGLLTTPTTSPVGSAGNSSFFKLGTEPVTGTSGGGSPADYTLPNSNYYDYGMVSHSSGNALRAKTAYLGGRYGGDFGFALDPGSSETINFTLGSRYNAFGLTFTANPEPETIVLASIVVAGFGALWYRRRQQALVEQAEACASSLTI